jgi:hypothetical protein
MITPAGFVTEAWLAIDPLRSWTAYYKWLQQGKWSWVALGVQLARLVVSFFPQPLWFLIFDDTFIYRSSKKGTGQRDIPSARQQSKPAAVCPGTMLGHSGAVHWFGHETGGGAVAVEADAKR